MKERPSNRSLGGAAEEIGFPRRFDLRIRITLPVCRYIWDAPGQIGLANGISSKSFVHGRLLGLEA